MSMRGDGGASAPPSDPCRPAARSRFFPSPLSRTITATLLVKLCVVVAMRMFLFDGAHRPVVDASAMDRHLTLSAPPR
ncbi:hypothetical protein CRT60_12020 [Azospirillum palustre]|uniref:Uncharacterized protein n=1 Tax=Azospirillum palustre TaxID=2044885 RepID=A0A2B8BIH1_9PROT|nr:hypothetical protein [Azospirillum palustre]PGH57192.1 hypothetical protein CRT60_12020 [Azospirillum palustre]